MIEWLMDGDPSIRWQVMRDLVDAPQGEVEEERGRVATNGWGARLLALQGSDGQWGGGAYSPKWISTTYTLLLLRHLGIDPGSPGMASATGRVRSRVTMAGFPFFRYRREMCVTGMTLALSSYFDGESDRGQLDHILKAQREDGGWNCETRSVRSSFHTTISVVEGLLEYESSVGEDDVSARARGRAHEYMAERGMLRSRSSGEVINPRWKLFSFPPRWHYDLLRGLEYLAHAGLPNDPRLDEALDLVESKRDTMGRWPLQNRHPGKEHFMMEESPAPSRWNTLRAMRVLSHFGRGS